MDQEMIDKVIKASFDCWNENRGLSYTVDDLSDSEKEFAQLHAIAIIKAMREPTEKMCKAEGVYIKCYTCGGHKEGWQNMIDAIIGEDF